MGHVLGRTRRHPSGIPLEDVLAGAGRVSHDDLGRRPARSEQDLERARRVDRAQHARRILAVGQRPYRRAVEVDRVRLARAGRQPVEHDDRVVVPGDRKCVPGRAGGRGPDLDLARGVGLDPDGDVVGADVTEQGTQDQLGHGQRMLRGCRAARIGVLLLALMGGPQRVTRWPALLVGPAAWNPRGCAWNSRSGIAGVRSTTPGCCNLMRPPPPGGAKRVHDDDQPDRTREVAPTVRAARRGRCSASPPSRGHIRDSRR